MEQKTIFKNFYKLGINLKINTSFPVFKYYLDILSKNQDNLHFLAKVGLCHGIFSEAYSEERMDKEYNKLGELL